MNTSALRILRRILFIDAGITAVFGLVLLIVGDPLSRWLSIERAWLLGAAVVLLPFAGLLVWAAVQAELPVRLVRALILGNVLWVVDTALLAFTPWLSPNGWGIAFILVQALAVAVLAGGQWFWVRRVAPLAGAGLA